jgi:hypothetical protein
MKVLLVQGVSARLQSAMTDEATVRQGKRVARAFSEIVRMPLGETAARYSAGAAPGGATSVKERVVGGSGGGGKKDDLDGAGANGLSDVDQEMLDNLEDPGVRHRHLNIYAVFIEIKLYFLDMYDVHCWYCFRAVT